MKKYLLLLFCFSCSKEMPEEKAKPVKVHAATAKEEKTPIFLETIGHVEPIVTVKVTSRVKGELTNVYFKEGDYVKEGDLLFTIDPRTFQADLKKAEGVLLENIANIKLAEEKVDRYRCLTREEYYSKLDFDTLVSDVDSLEGVIKQNQAEIELAKVNLGYCWIYSPLNGRTGILEVDKGNLVQGDETETLIVINQMKPIYVTYSFPEKYIYKIRKAAQKNHTLSTVAAFSSFKEETFEGKLEMLDNMVETSTGMIKLRSVFANENEELWPKQFVRIRLILDEVEAVIIPFESVVITSKGPFVYVVKEDMTVDFVKVELGERVDENIIVKKGIHKGEKVVTQGQIGIYPGASVEIAETKAES